MPPDEFTEMPDAREVFKAMKTLMDQWKLFYQMQGGTISPQDANCFKVLGAILDSQIKRQATRQN